jgi:hypothetical protein
MNEETTDYHDFTWPAMPLEDRKRLQVGPLYINAAICNECNFFVRSRNRYDYRSCKCGNVSVDGGSQYAKRTFKLRDYQDVLVQFDNLSESEKET